MRFLFASDSFKGTLSSEEINEILTKTAKKVFTTCECQSVVVADGGEGTLEAVVSATKGCYEHVMVYGPRWQITEAKYATIGSDKAVIEMAQASGLPMLPMQMRNPKYTSSYGTGQLIKDALEKGYRDITIGIGGSATNDGGIGAMSALGVKFLNNKGECLKGIGEELASIDTIDITNLHPAVKKTKFTVMCDVTNPLTGLSGATYTYGEQKGADQQCIIELENGMLHYEKKLLEVFGVAVNKIPGSGAAGGLGAALCVFLNASIKSGIDTVLDLIDFNSKLNEADIVITGEGRIDWQSVQGKVLSGVGARCKKANIPAVAIVGGMGYGAEKIYEYGISSIISTVNAPMELNEALERAKELYESAAERMFRLIKIGVILNNK